MKNKTSVILAVFLLLGVGWLAKSWYRASPAMGYVPKPMVVQTAKVQKHNMPEIFHTVAVLDAKQAVTVSNGVAGQVKKIVLPNGGYVKENQLLVTLSPAFDVRSPINGYLTDWQVSEGAFLPVGTPLVKVVNKSILTVSYYVPEQYAAKLKEKQKIEIRVRAFPGTVFEGIVNFVSPVVELKNHSILVRAEIPNISEKLAPGLFTEIAQILSKNINALSIPESSLISTLEGYEVFKVVDSKKVTRQVVKVGQRAKGMVQILSGLQVDDEVIITHPPGLREGMEVVPKLWQGELSQEPEAAS